MGGPPQPPPPGKPGGQDLPPPPVSPFGPGDDSVLDTAKIQQQATATRTALRGVQDNLLRRRYGNSEPREFTRMDGPWPFLLIRTYPGDVGSRPVQAADVPPTYSGMKKSPDIIVTQAGPAEPRIIDDRAGLSALKERELTADLGPGRAYDVWVHVWNLGRNQVSGVRVRVRLDHIVFKNVRAGGFLGGTTLDLGDRLSEQAHRAVKVATFQPPFLGISIAYTMLLIATANCVSDPASGDLSPGADRHSAHHALTALALAGPIRPPQ